MYYNKSRSDVTIMSNIFCYEQRLHVLYRVTNPSTAFKSNCSESCRNISKINLKYHK